MNKPKILAFAGSTRKDSYNKKLIKIAAEFAKQAGGDVTLIDLRDYSMPLYDGDLEAEKGNPEIAMKLRRMMEASDGFLLSCPEYNSSISAVLKNTIDWVSRPLPGEANLSAFTGKVVSLMSASPGMWGGMRGLVHVRSILGNIGCIVLPDQRCIAKAMDAFDEQGQLKNADETAGIKSLSEGLIRFFGKHQ